MLLYRIVIRFWISTGNSVYVKSNGYMLRQTRNNNFCRCHLNFLLVVFFCLFFFLVFFIYFYILFCGFEPHCESRKVDQSKDARHGSLFGAGAFFSLQIKLLQTNQDIKFFAKYEHGAAALDQSIKSSKFRFLYFERKERQSNRPSRFLDSSRKPKIIF